ncbi:MAG: cation transporter [Deltaproteobacteria bacterium]|jgi:cation diffusion facilitator family transporter|nr:cation transporter [Deltaproteobacteria bacterium]MBT4266304.1 cation transporter [Deltaproteobacteria bacterium]MBT4640014.1 cation transporter [Deltaproteobacteria bacterium]MBT6503107.1 cation transporter [Deltaproteobacteria bacterium]MBT7152353.1 cation transporter [Deltaproteobacteria bacterium]
MLAPLDQSGKESVQVTVVGVVANLALSLLKGVVGFISLSSALIADAIHSLSDLLSDAVTLWAIYISRKPIDNSHPYGHGKFEAVGTFFISLMLILAGFGIATHSINQLNEPVVPGILAVWIAAFSIVSKELLYRYASYVGHKHQSRILLANAWHHRTDAISSLVALAGIVGAVLGYPLLDPIAAIVVSGWIIKTGLAIGYESLMELTDKGVEQDILKSINEVLTEIKGVEHFHKVRARRMGPYMLVDLHIEVAQTISVSVSHQIAERVRFSIVNQIPSVNEVLVHVDAENHPEENPVKLMRPQKEIEAEIQVIVNTFQEIEALTHVLCHYLNETLTVEIGIAVDPIRQIIEAKEIASQLKLKIELVDDIQTADIHLEI